MSRPDSRCASGPGTRLWPGRDAAGHFGGQALGHIIIVMLENRA
jgi:hypothetical protein